MAVMILLSVAVCISLVTVVFGCLICRRKLTEQEIQQKAFEKFRKRHVSRRKILSSRVDYVRSVSEGKSASCVTGASDHTYHEMFTPPIPHPPVVHAEDPSPQQSSDYSFFDDSFQTVIEASSSNASSSNSGTANLLMAPMSSHASYMSLQHDQSKTTEEPTSSEGEGEVNPGFSDSSNISSSYVGSSDSLDNSYIVPVCGPKIKIIQPSLRRKFDMSVPLANIQSRMSHIQSNEIHIPVENLDEIDARPRNIAERVISDTRKFNEDNNYLQRTNEKQDLSKKRERQMLRQKNLQKLALEGPTYSEKCKTLDSSGKDSYEQLRDSRYEHIMYKSLNKTALILPGRPRLCSPLTPLQSKSRSRSDSPSRSKQKSTTSKCSDHTYESINSILASEANRRDSVASVDSTFNRTDSDYPRTSLDGCPHITRQNDLSPTSPDHTYESIECRKLSDVNAGTAFDNSAVIIGRRVSNPFDSGKKSRRTVNKKKQRSVKSKPVMHQTEVNVHKNNDDRYSPFPSTKKLAFKSAFRQVPSPRFSVIKTVAGGLRDNQFGFQPELFPDNLNIKTPEIKVENCQQFFNNTAFISPKLLNSSTNYLDENDCPIEKDAPNLVSPMRTYLTLKDCYSSKISNTNLQASLTEKMINYRKSLPSLTDDLDEDIIRHCNTNMYSRSTPCELDQPETCIF